MVTSLLGFAFEHPRAIETAGELTARVAGVALAAGALFQALAGVLASLPGAQPGRGAHSFLPGLPTWWVPESAAGVLAWSIVFGVGLTAMFAGRQLRRDLEAYR